MSQFKQGDTVYSASGRMAEYVGQSGFMHVVRAMYEDEESGEVYLTDVEEWRNVFSTEEGACQKLGERAAHLDAEITQQENKLREINAKLRDAEVEEKKMMDRLKRHDALKFIDDFLDGQITHYVARSIYYDSYKIIPFDGEEGDYGRSDGKYRLLTLSPEKNYRGISWYLNKYSDGSGNREDRVRPCKSEAEAIEKVKELINGSIAVMLSIEKSKRRGVSEIIDNCKEFGIEVPESLLNDYNEMLNNGRNRRLESALKEVEKIKAEMQN